MDNARQIKDKPMADVLNDMLGGIDHSQPFHIVSHSDELPKELQRLVIDSDKAEVRFDAALAKAKDKIGKVLGL
jgi:hypothetical protein